MSIEPSQRASCILNMALRQQRLTPQNVASLHYDEVRGQYGCGAKTIDEIEDWLAQYGLTFRDHGAIVGSNGQGSYGPLFW